METKPIYLKRYFKVVLLLVLLIATFLFLLSLHVSNIADKKIYSIDDIPKTKAVLVLGCGIKDGKPSPMLKNRLDSAIRLYNRNKVDVLYLSGYKDSDYYDEVKVMKEYCLNSGIPVEVIVEDKQGNDTFKSVSNIEKTDIPSYIIVTQNWHLKRALYISTHLSDKVVYGYLADDISHVFSMFRMNSREVLARVKVFYDLLKTR